MYKRFFIFILLLCIATTCVEAATLLDGANASASLGSFLLDVWSVIKTILGIVVILLILVFWQYILETLLYLGIFAGIGAIVFGILFGNAGLGAVIGLAVAAFLGIRLLIDELGPSFNGILLIAYYIISAPVFALNKLEFILVEPWRYVLKRSWIDEDSKPFVRSVLRVMSVLMYIVTTPLRLFNAIIYNIFIHCVTVLYDLLFEVFMPSDPEEGAGSVKMWILYFSLRLVKYLFWHGFLAIVESLIWTVVDVFIPAITLYHGTDLTASEAIASDPFRNAYMRNTSTWSYGTFTASTSSWGGIGVYFAAMRNVARSYAEDPHRLNDTNPVMIACRVSLGRVINYSLAPIRVYNQAGQYGNHSELNHYGEKNGYITGEWWNDHGGYWEFCMFDWESLYDHPWRIRPIYILNFRTGRAQHIKGGMQHWLFDHAVLKNIIEELKLKRFFK
ncbi:MAG: hypothetical protein J6X58_00335 [Bacteroidales bacterium]|nr:hypothetical protein [Bacteroidales bacterium]